MNRFDGEMGSVRGMRSLSSLLLLAATFVFAQADIARGQNDYPNRPIQLVVTVPPGGAADFVGRLIGAKLADALGQPVVISNRGGAGGTTAAAAGRQIGSRWLHAAVEYDRDPRHRPAHLRQPALRPGEGFFSRRPDCQATLDLGGQRRGTHPLGQGRDCAREGAAG